MNAYENHVSAQRGKIGDEAADDAIEVINLLRGHIIGTDFVPPEPKIINPTDGSIVSGWVMIETVETSGAGDVESALFEYSYDSVTWTMIAEDKTEPDGWWAEWDSLSVPDGNYLIRVMMTDYAGNSGMDEVMVTVDNFIVSSFLSFGCLPM